ncbi:GNAT family N-acetyltransferase [Glutamicibacter sp. MNS18]|uniref:GNAT family N-acetyltransferase n=1 Tax=Glutamicibacter sp. MNS18 TaxID=2989817 RepID=UPI00223693BD|nr:GNAT family N-acetyltransferase [Glutamicibacter sp. MNS18]MCW4465373.1 GNAT family N-acetyltransferase [Glutamicibacter sp. MNS18]
MTDPPPIELRGFTSQDIGFVTQLATDERVVRFVGSGQPWSAGYISERADAALAEDPLDRVGSCRWFIATRRGEPVGLLVAARRTGSVEIGYWVAPASWGQGVAGSILAQAVGLASGIFGCSVLSARVMPGNEASIRLLQRNGFQPQPADTDIVRFLLDTTRH